MRLRLVKPPGRPPRNWSTLLPCPFCSGAARMVSSTTNHHPVELNGYTAFVECTRCGGNGPMIEVVDQPRSLMSIERQAARLWNKRGNLAGAETKLRRIALILNGDG